MLELGTINPDTSLARACNLLNMFLKQRIFWAACISALKSIDDLLIVINL